MKKYFYIVILIIIMFPAITMGYDFDQDSGLNTTGNATGHASSGIDTPQAMISTVIEIALSFLGILFLILIIYGGYTWMMARGNEQEIEKASNIIKASIIGLIIVLGAYVISSFILNSLSNATLKNTMDTISNFKV